MHNSGMVLINLPYACFGMVYENGIIVRTPPIAHWCMNRNAQEVVNYFHNKGAKVQITVDKPLTDKEL